MILCRCGTGARTLGAGDDGSLLQPKDAGPSLIDRFKAVFKSQEFWLEIEGLPPIAAIGADWNPKPLPASGSGLICPVQQVFFSPANKFGTVPWGPEAKDNEDEWSMDWCISRENPPARQKEPNVPMVLVAKSFANILCGRENIHASIAKR